MKLSAINRSQKYTNVNKVKKDKKNTSFKGAGIDCVFNVVDKFFGVLDKNPMIQVSFVDTVSTNIPRTLMDLSTGLAAAFETCRREFSGLFVNCLMPGLIVKGIASILPKSKEIAGTDVAASWANGASTERFKEIYKSVQDSDTVNKAKEYAEKVLGSIEGLDGKNWVRYADKSSAPKYKEAVEEIVKATSVNGKSRKMLLKDAQSKIAEVTKAENILRFNGVKQSNLEETLRDMTDLYTKFETVKNNSPKGAVKDAIDKYSSSLINFVNKKSIIGMILVIGIAVSIQTINRAITRKQFKAAGAPIYKDFGKKDTTQKMDEKEKKRFKIKKLLSAIGMYGLAALSMMKKPTMGMFQFSGIFPTMDQCRWIAASTFASRMLGAEDDNELRETTVRDIASFSGLYFLGDYAKKGAASAIEALSKTKKGAELFGGNVVLLNRSKEIEKPVIEQCAAPLQKAFQQGKYRLKQFGNWIKNTELKTAAEVSSTKVKNLRNICRMADIAFSIVMLGIILPKYNRAVTEKKVAAAKLRAEQENKSRQEMLNRTLKNTPEIFKELVKN